VADPQGAGIRGPRMARMVINHAARVFSDTDARPKSSTHADRHPNTVVDPVPASSRFMARGSRRGCGQSTFESAATCAVKVIGMQFTRTGAAIVIPLACPAAPFGTAARYQYRLITPSAIADRAGFGPSFAQDSDGALATIVSWVIGLYLSDWIWPSLQGLLGKDAGRYSGKNGLPPAGRCCRLHGGEYRRHRRNPARAKRRSISSASSRFRAVRSGMASHIARIRRTAG